MLYTAFMADIVNSKKLLKEDREDLQIYIKKILAKLNMVFESSLVFQVIFSAGDEVQGLFKNPTSAVMYYRLLRMLVSPLEIRCGMGVGTWDVKIIDGTSTEQDGLAYHNAREAIDLSHKNTADYCIIFNSESENDLYINTLLNSAFSFYQMQSDYQKQFNLLLEMSQPFYNEYMEMKYFKEILVIIKEREALNFYSKTKFNIFENVEIRKFQCEPLNVFEESLFKNKIYIEPTVKKGTSVKLASIINTTRQNTDKILKSANVGTIRNIELTALLYLNKNFKGVS